MSHVNDQRQALGLRLRQLRTDAGLSGRVLAEQLGWPQSKISKLENGRQTPTRDDITAWCGELGREDAAPDLLHLLTVVHTLYEENRRAYRAGLAAVQTSIAGIEERAETIRAFEPVLVPGLLQTADYARTRLVETASLFGLARDADDDVAGRMQRQMILYDRHRRFHFVITEAALRVGMADPEVMLGQIDRLTSATTLPNVRLGVIPFGPRPGYAPMHGFWLFDDAMACVETIAAELTLTHADEIGTYRTVFDRLAGSAVYGAEARRLLAAAARELADCVPAE